jgi:Resolvase, N terminal domain
LVLGLFGALAEFERGLIVERTQAGLAAARIRGQVGGRPPTLTPEKRAAIDTVRAAGDSPTHIARAPGVSERTIRAVPHMHPHVTTTDGPLIHGGDGQPSQWPVKEVNPLAPGLTTVAEPATPSSVCTFGDERQQRFEGLFRANFRAVASYLLARGDRDPAEEAPSRTFEVA